MTSLIEKTEPCKRSNASSAAEKNCDQFKSNLNDRLLLLLLICGLAVTESPCEFVLGRHQDGLPPNTDDPGTDGRC